MPVGLPKVAYRLSDKDDAEYNWSNLYDRLQRRRILFFAKTLTQTLSNQLNAAMIYLNTDDSTKTQYMYINSTGGSINWGLGVHDTMQYIGSTVCTTCVGVSASVASLVLAGGTPGNRFALPHARMMIHQPEGDVDGLGGPLGYELIEVERARELLIKAYVLRTGQSTSQIEYDLGRDAFMLVEAATFYGLIDGVAEISPANAEDPTS
jgi:ATP-dependent Clp protease protease subunit